MRFPNKMSIRVYIFITIIITLPLLFFSFLYARETKDNLYKEKKVELLGIATTIDHRLLSCNQIIGDKHEDNLTTNEKVALINKRIQPIADEITKEYPNRGVGFYCKAINRIVAVEPTTNQSYLGYKQEILDFFAKDSEKSNTYAYNELQTSLNWGEKSILNLTFPIYRDGSIIGYVWVNSKTEDINREYYYLLTKNIIITMLIWMLVVLIVWWVLRKLSIELEKLAEQISAGDGDTSNFAQFPELLPFLKTIIDSKKELIHQKNLLRLMIEHIPGVFIAIDKNMKVTIANKGVNRLINTKKVVGKNFIDVLIKENITINKPYILRSLTNGEVFMKRKVIINNGIFQVDSSPIKDPKSNEIVGAVSYFFDITKEEQKNEEQKILLNEYFNQSQNLQYLLDSIPIAFLAIDSDERLIAINNKATQIFKLKDGKALIGKPFQVIAENMDIPYKNLYLYRAFKGEDIHNEHKHIFDYELIVNAYPIICKNNNKNGAIALYQDVTELEILRQEIEHIERLNMVGQMAASITHEIRNPMATIRGFIQLLRERSEMNSKEYFDIIIDELDRTNNIITDFLSLSQSRVIEMSDYNLNNIINELYPILLADANIKGQYLEINLFKALSNQKMNKKEMKQLILNLARNATEAMGQSGVLTIATNQRDAIIELQISDTGVGIQKDRIDKLFQPFYTTKEGGTGLGLSVSKSIVEKHGGEIIINSIEGQGTSFIIKFNVT